MKNTRAQPALILALLLRVLTLAACGSPEPRAAAPMPPAATALLAQFVGTVADDRVMMQAPNDGTNATRMYSQTPLIVQH